MRKAPRERGLLLGIGLAVGLHMLGLGVIWAAVAGGLGGWQINRALPRKLGDPESWRRFQAAYPDSIGQSSKPRIRKDGT